ncbi:hypothetical protein BCR42DRAFT_183077 [Absidia repens]|uniref:Uncharacterized protein n=1 Tax=Absidia repens TaxID=90262 RepID=A0A1X2HZJ6_9FUNG|nr:hypothetical protein BCR42DRAFT_183077 [Absidia repens]
MLEKTTLTIRNTSTLESLYSKFNLIMNTVLIYNELNITISGGYVFSNIFFSALIGGMVFFLPTAGFYTQHYLTASLIVWATTFCLFTLFLPKLLHLRKSFQVINKVSDCPKRPRQQQRLSYSPASSKSEGAYLNSKFGGSSYQHQQHEQSFGELLSMNGVLNADRSRQNSCQTNYHHQQKQKQQQKQHRQFHYHMQHRQLYYQTHNNIDPLFSKSTRKRDRKNGFVVDAYEALVPMRFILKTIPWLSSWDMMQMVLMPEISYFSYFAERTAKGDVFGYSHASVICASNETFILKIHGLRFYDILIQMANQEDLLDWCKWFNSKPSLILPQSNERQEQKNSNQHAPFNGTKAGCDAIHKTAQHRLPQKSTTLDSGITTRHLLADETDDEFDVFGEQRRESCFTLDTLGCDEISPWIKASHSVMGGDHKKGTMDIPPLPIDASIKPPWNVDTPSPTINDNQTLSRKASSYFTGIFTSSSAAVASASDLNTPDSDTRTIVDSPTTMDDDVIMMRDL